MQLGRNKYPTSVPDFSIVNIQLRLCRLRLERNPMRLSCFLFIAVFVLFSSPVSAGVYYYRDKSGVLHFTDSLSEIPQDRLPEARRYGEGDKHPMPERLENRPGQKDEAPGEGKEEGKGLPIFERLNKEKAYLGAERVALMQEGEELKKTKPTVNTPEKVKAYQKAMSGFNKRVGVYNERNRAFQKEVDAYNTAIRGEGEK